ncbi:MAG: putative oxidoreductase [Phycisphaerae bacterium]|nr:putative oxidoreductase [Phycisphaerae bacterium]
MKTPSSAGGWHSILYSLRKARQAGGILKFYRALRSKNACKTCALGMGGQAGGMVNERGRFPEVCKKSMQAMAADMQGRVRPEFFARYGFTELRSLSPRELEAMGRLDEPVYAGADDTHYRPISWDAALAMCADRLKRTPADRNFFYFSGRASNEAAFLWQLFARLYGTNNVNNCSYYCHQASGVALRDTLGTSTATVMLDDIERCDLFFLIGGNPASNHPRLMTMLADLRRRGGHVVVVNPLREVGLVKFRVPSRLGSLLFGSKIASRYVQPHIGGDIALLTGIAKRVVEIAGCPAELHSAFDDVTENSGAFLEHLDSLSWEQIEEASGVDGAEIDEIADLYAASEGTIFAWTMGITHHLHGTDNVRAIVNLALLRGMVGRLGAGLLPIRGHSNVQGVGSVGVMPKLRHDIFERLQSHFGVTLPATPGLDTLACVEAMRDGRLSSGWCLGGNLFGATPDSPRTADAFSRLESIVYLSTTLNTGHAWGRARETLILPVRARDEESQPTTQESMFNYVRLSDGGPARLPGPRSEVELVAHLAHEVLGSAGPINWRGMREHGTIRRAIAAVVPGFEEMARIDETRREFHIGGRILHEPKFRTPSGRAKFSVVRIPGHEPSERPDPATGQPDTGAHHLRLMTIRSEGQFNTVVYEDQDVYRGQDRRDVILMNPADVARLGLRPDQPVSVRSAAGAMHGVRVRPFDIRSGNAAMYFPECNVLVPMSADPESRTPAYKSVDVLLTSPAARL